MGRIADLVEEVEDGLSEAIQEIKGLESTVADLEDALQDANQLIKEQSEFISWVESYYTEAEQQYQALCTVRGE
jgi:t-SNARE complex subunit (syntaxin)